MSWSVWPVEAVSVQHLQQQVVQRHFVLALHAVEVLHAFVAAGNRNRRSETIAAFFILFNSFSQTEVQKSH